MSELIFDTMVYGSRECLLNGGRRSLRRCIQACDTSQLRRLALYGYLRENMVKTTASRIKQVLSCELDRMRSLTRALATKGERFVRPFSESIRATSVKSFTPAL